MYTYVCVYIHTHVYTHIYVYIYIHTHIHMQIQALRMQLRQALEDRRSAFAERDAMKTQLDKKLASLDKLKRDAKDCECMHVRMCICVHMAIHEYIHTHMQTS